MRHLEPDLTFVSQIYTLQKEKIYAVTLKNHLLDLKNAPVIPYGAAFDIGTTTVVGYLINPVSYTHLTPPTKRIV